MISSQQWHPVVKPDLQKVYNDKGKQLKVGRKKLS